VLGGRRHAYAYTAGVSRSDQQIAAVEQICGTLGADARERQHMAAVVWHGSQGVW